MINKQFNSNRGFSLIEMLVALSLFTIVITTVTGSLLILISGNGRLQGEQSVMTNLTFALDSMTREIRTGTHYNCRTSSYLSSGSNNENLGTSTNSCASGSSGISFRESGSSISGAANDRIAYYYDSTNDTIMRRVGNLAPQSIVSSGIEVTSAEFFVTGANSFTNSGNSDIEQPTVTIVLEANETGAASDKSFVVQTTVTQRQLDI